jgi:hypothetical protein
MIAMLVGEGDGGNPTQVQTHSLGSAVYLSSAEAGVDQEGNALCLDCAAVPPGAGAQDIEGDHRVLL